jgi:acyl-CoA reductase-like NAD-dependent aldehyde dehydrogenase
MISNERQQLLNEFADTLDRQSDLLKQLLNEMSAEEVQGRARIQVLIETCEATAKKYREGVDRQ